MQSTGIWGFLSFGYAGVLDYAQKVADAISDQALKAEAQTIAADLKKAIAAAIVTADLGVT